MRRALFGALTLCGCLPANYMPVGQRYNAMCQTWIGDTVSHLMVTWGAPTQITKLPDGTQLYDFDEINGAALQAWSLEHFTHVQVHGGIAWCDTRFVIQPDGHVASYDWHGNDYTDANGNTTVGCFTTFLPPIQPVAPMPAPAPAGPPQPPMPPQPGEPPMPPQPPPVAQDPTAEPAGIGAVVAERDGIIFVQSIETGSSAAAAGVVAGDVILAVNGTDVHGATLAAVTGMVRGAAGTTVALTIEHAGQIITINCQRRTL